MLPQAVSSCVRQQTEENGHREEGRETGKIRRERELKLGTKMQKDHSAPLSLRYPHQVLRESTFGADVLQHMQILHSSTSVIVTEPVSPLKLPLELLQTALKRRQIEPPPHSASQNALIAKDNICNFFEDVCAKTTLLG